MSIRYFIIAAALCVSCKGIQAQEAKYDCVLTSGDFEEASLIRGETVRKAFEKFTDNTEEGAFFLVRYFNKADSYKAIILDVNGETISVYDDDVIKEISLEATNVEFADSLVSNVEVGSFRQVCYEGPSEGSLSLLLVKKGNIVLKYEARQYNYLHLNEAQKIKIKTALELIDFMSIDEK